MGWNLETFQSGRSINPAKLGLINKNDIEKVMPNLRPYMTRFKQLQEQDEDKIYIVSLDDGTENRCENFTNRAYENKENPYEMLVYILKERLSYESSRIAFKSFSMINEDNIDKEGRYILLDDMFASGGSVDKVSTMLKSYGAKYIEAWVVHAVTAPSQIEKVKRMNRVDKIVCLDTVIQDPELGFEYIHASADLLAAELYKVHQKFLSNR